MRSVNRNEGVFGINLRIFIRRQDQYNRKYTLVLLPVIGGIVSGDA